MGADFALTLRLKNFNGPTNLAAALDHFLVIHSINLYSSYFSYQIVLGKIMIFLALGQGKMRKRAK